MREDFVYTVAAHIHQATETYRKTDFFIASMKRAGALQVEVLEDEPLPDGGRRWKAKITENSRIPAFIRASDIVIVINESVFSPSEKRLTFRISPAAESVRVRLEGSIEIKERAGATELHYSIDLTVGIPLLGRQTEALGLKIVKEECRKQARLLEEWAAHI